jgi:hypothetical protein
MSVEWYDYLSTAGTFVFLLALFYAWVERRHGHEPGDGYAAVLGLAIVVKIPEAWAEGDLFWLALYMWTLGFGAGVFLVLWKQRDCDVIKRPEHERGS